MIVKDIMERFLDKKRMVCEILHVEALDMDCRVPEDIQEELQRQCPDLHFYDIQHDSCGEGNWVQVKDFVGVNYLTTIVCKQPLPVPHLLDEDDWGYQDEVRSLREFLLSSGVSVFVTSCVETVFWKGEK